MWYPRCLLSSLLIDTQLDLLDLDFLPLSLLVLINLLSLANLSDILDDVLHIDLFVLLDHHQVHLIQLLLLELPPTNTTHLY